MTDQEMIKVFQNEIKEYRGTPFSWEYQIRLSGFGMQIKQFKKMGMEGFTYTLCWT